MKLPSPERVRVPRAKIVDYLLSLSHPDGAGKARFFQRFGFSTGRWRILAAALRYHAGEHEIERMDDSPFGVRYTVVGPLRTPDGRNPVVRSVWFKARGGEVPRFVTAYPVRRSRL